MHYLYVKAPVKSSSHSRVHFLPAFFLFGGLFLLASAAGPILFYQLFFSPGFQRELVSPVGKDFLVTTKVEKGEVLGKEIIETNADMSRVANWFPSAPRFSTQPSKITHYTISVPKLGIKNAVVEIGGENLKKSLVQYAGTAFPGQFGNTVIFGHSTLPQFFNPQNYVSIFSTLPTLKKNDMVFVDFDGVEYRYQIEEMIEVSPDDISVLEQRYDRVSLTLVTCVPPGTYLRRLIVRARLVPL